ncbi:MAG: FadR/GntR family transcriptional regulator [Pseudolysinimonas sp.]
MSEASRAPGGRSFLGTEDARIPAARLGVAVVHDLVSAIVTGEVAPGETLPPEADLSAHFGVSRTVIRESVKRLEEKGLVTVAQGRGTLAQPSASWNILDPVVLSVLLENDSSLGVLDELATVRSALEGSMSAEVASRHSDADLEQLRAAYAHMAATIDDEDAYNQADFDFHALIMTLSGNRLAENITKILFQRARASQRFTGSPTAEMFRQTFLEHGRVLTAIESGDPTEAAAAMQNHIVVAWQRRRLPNAKHG